MLSLFDNYLTGTVPSELANLSSLKELYLEETSLNASFIEEICSLALKQFSTDCDEIGGCSCCTRCCVDDLTCF